MNFRHMIGRWINPLLQPGSGAHGHELLASLLVMAWKK